MREDQRKLFLANNNRKPKKKKNSGKKNDDITYRNRNFGNKET